MIKFSKIQNGRWQVPVKALQLVYHLHKTRSNSNHGPLGSNNKWAYFHSENWGVQTIMNPARDHEMNTDLGP